MTAPRPRAHEAYERIISMIFQGVLRSGDLLQEAALGEIFGMSRTPVREAIKRLESEGLAVVEGRFTCVRSVTPADAEEVFFLRLELEPLAARSAVRLPPAEIDAMEAKVRHLMASDPVVTDLQRQTDHEFHQLLGREFGNQAVSQTIAALHRRTCIFDHRRLPDRFRDGCEEHLAILEAARGGDADRVEAALRLHIEHAREAVIQHLHQAMPGA
ncbi:GntR family transcriptional regulator [Cereibacter azotoformans]|uniref:GntR family transcriptional regulator n=2 Tax=Cereibacter TaxID=1653176 RepID=A0A2T5KAV2_9RHOB|nr:MULTISPECIES: GntR family transcriptional regulator [Cereibacter]AXQ93953.1 GntR family transcriptional regulator [Cereibacter sphaeroides]MBO4168234.1 GntR family transcriptional regulator [Cereibacter azotoformans]PTR19548.1 GntR family transcriptional regulator [Cereibacter azotoformans]UIJ29472.1 GntR family transcriptional regulator [Cereibacter azotoformans]ULB10186.1 GntR family transcriptional regulator [Cereibacter azotoformans]